MRISDWSSDVCSSDLLAPRCLRPAGTKFRQFNSSRLGMDPMTLAAAPAPSLPVITPFIDGRPRASSRPLFENRDPTTGMVTSLVHEAAGAAVDEAVSPPRRATPGPRARFTDPPRAHPP